MNTPPAGIPVPSPLTLRRVIFVSEARALAMAPPAKAALISITDTERLSRPKFQPGWAAVLRISFDDLDPLTFPQLDDVAEALQPDEVVRLARFVALQAQLRQRIVVHCLHGVSRSAAVARAIAHATALPFPAHYDRHNRYVFRLLHSTLLAALEQDRAIP